MEAHCARMLGGAAAACLLAAALIGPAAAAPLAVAAGAASYPLGPQADYFEDTGGGASLEYIGALPAGAWRRLQNEIPNFGYSRSAHWFRIRLLNSGAEPLLRYFELGYPLLKEVDLYLSVAGGAPWRWFSGDDRAGSDSVAFGHRNFVFPLLLPPGRPIELLLRVRTTGSAQIPMTLWQPAAFQAASERELAAFGLYGGVMLAMAAYNLFIFFCVRLRAYLYYVLFIACSGLVLLMMQGVGTQAPWLSAIGWREHGIAVLVSATAAFGGLFASSFLRLRSHSRGLDNALLWVVGAAVGSAVLATALPYAVAIRLAVPIVMLWIMLVVGAGVFALWRGEEGARFYLAAWGSFLVAAFCSGLYQYGIIPRGLANGHALLAGSALETVLLSFALADRINRMRRQTAEAQSQALHHLRRFETLVEQAQYGIFAVTLDGAVVSANEAAARILGYESPAELKASLPDIRDSYVESDARQRMLARLFEAGYCNGFETRLRHRDGSAVWVSFSSRLTRDEAGRRCIEGSYIDISERKQREQAEQARQVAEQERTLALESARSKAAFLSNVSYEIRTPLTAIVGYGELLLEANVDVAQRQDLARTLLSSSHHLLDLVNDVIDLSMIDAGRLELERQPVDLAELLQELEAAFADRTRRKGLSFRIQRRFPLPRAISTDPARLRQILYNLCGNAVKFTESGGVTLELSCDAQRHQLRIVVTDTGCGVEPERRRRLFEPFSGADAAAGRRYGGSGLGLPISRQLARVLGGDLVCDSEPGRGSRFELSVGVDPAELAGLLQAPAAAEAVDADLPWLCGRVLYAEDNRESQRLARHLAAAGAQSAASAPAAAAFHDGLPDALASIMQAVARADWVRTASLALRLRQDGDSHGCAVLARLAGELAKAAAAAAPEAVLRALESLRRQLDTVDAKRPAERSGAAFGRLH